jgi:hypothetical protein
VVDVAGAADYDVLHRDVLHPSASGRAGG